MSKKGLGNSTGWEDLLSTKNKKGSNRDSRCRAQTVLQ